MTHATCTRAPAPAFVCLGQRIDLSPLHTAFRHRKPSVRLAAWLPRTHLSATGSAAYDQPVSDGPDAHSVSNPVPQPVQKDGPRRAEPRQPSESVIQRVKRFFTGDKLDMQRLKALGLGAVASYGCVSNVTYGTGLSISWIAFVRQTGRSLQAGCCEATLLLPYSVSTAGKSPLMANQWKPFLALYGGFWAAQNFIRPLRFSLAIAMSPVFDQFINWVQQRTKWKRQNAFAVYLFLLGSITSIAVFGSIRLFAGPIAFATV